MSTPKAPRPPLNLSPDKTYIHITTPSTPSFDPQTLPQQLPIPSIQLQYVGKVGELKGEHVYEVVHGASGESLRRDGEFWVGVKGDVLKGLKGLQGIKGVEFMELKKRVKRDEF